MGKRQWVNKPEKGENKDILQHTMRIARLPLIDVQDTNEVNKRIDEYFDICIEDDMPPTVAELATALGTSRWTLLNDWQINARRSIPDEVSGQVERAIQIINGFDETKISKSGNIVGEIFLMKNSFHEYTDKREIVHRMEAPQLTQQELMERARQLPDFDK